MGHEQEDIGKGTVVRDRKWGGMCTGTVVRREGGSGPRRIFSQASTRSVAELPRVSVNTASIVLAMAPEPRR